MVKIDDLTLEFVSVTPKLADKNKDFEMLNGDIVRYTRRKNAVSLSCKGLIEKSELDSLQNILNKNVEYTVEYQLNGLHSAVMLVDGALSFRKIMINSESEFWEVSFNLKECRSN